MNVDHVLLSSALSDEAGRAAGFGDETGGWEEWLVQPIYQRCDRRGRNKPWPASCRAGPHWVRAPSAFSGRAWRCRWSRYGNGQHMWQKAADAGFVMAAHSYFPAEAMEIVPLSEPGTSSEPPQPFLAGAAQPDTKPLGPKEDGTAQQIMQLLQEIQNPQGTARSPPFLGENPCIPFFYRPDEQDEVKILVVWGVTGWLCVCMCARMKGVKCWSYETLALAVRIISTNTEQTWSWSCDRVCSSYISRAPLFICWYYLVGKWLTWPAKEKYSSPYHNVWFPSFLSHPILHLSAINGPSASPPPLIKRTHQFEQFAACYVLLWFNAQKKHHVWM